jgi:hypothetical protein
MASWVMQMMSTMGYVGLVLLIVLENVFPPIPSEVIMPLAGFMVTQDRLSLLGVIVAGTLGSIFGALCLSATSGKRTTITWHRICTKKQYAGLLGVFSAVLAGMRLPARDPDNPVHTEVPRASLGDLIWLAA